MFVCLVASHDVTRMAQLLGVSTSGYYKHRDRPRAPEPTPRIQRRRNLEVTILTHHKDSGGTYGPPRITVDCGEGDMYLCATRDEHSRRPGQGRHPATTD